MYNFNEDLQAGLHKEANIIRLVGTGQIRKATRQEERKGIDFIVSGNKQKQITIQVKCDNVAAQTGNIFLELVDVWINDSRYKDIIKDHRQPGWVVTCKADWIFYAVPLLNRVWIMRPDDVRAYVDDMNEMLKQKRRRFLKQPNLFQLASGQWVQYQAMGLAVPLEEIYNLKVATCVHTLTSYNLQKWVQAQIT